MRLLFTALFCLLGFSASRPALAATCTWTGGNGAWSAASNWSCGLVPGGADAVTINSFVTVTLDADVTIGDFSLANGTLDGDGDLTVTGAFTWSDGGRLLGTGSMTVQGGTTITGQVAVQLGRPLDLASNTTWASNNITIREGGMLRNRSGRTFTDNAAAGQTHSISVPGGTNTLPTIENVGTWVHAGAGTSILANFVNTGTLVVAGDGLEFVGPSQFTQSNIATLTGEALLDVDSGITFSNAGSTRPGESADVPAILSVRGDFPMTTHEHDLQIDLRGPAAGTQHDQLAVENGDVTVNGRLYLTFADGFVPTVGQSFDVLAHTGSGTVTGCYDADDIIVNPEEYDVTVACTSEGITAEVIGVTAGEPTAAPGAFTFSAAYPNPFREHAAFTLTAPTAQRVTVVAFDALGRTVGTLFEGAVAAGEPVAVTLRAGTLPSGLYVVRATGEGGVQTRRVTLLR